jgi:hypothetical protein
MQFGDLYLEVEKSCSYQDELSKAAEQCHEIGLTPEYNQALCDAWTRYHPIFLRITDTESNTVAYWVLGESHILGLPVMNAYCQPCVLEPEHLKPAWAIFLRYIHKKHPVAFRMDLHALVRLASVDNICQVAASLESPISIQPTYHGTILIDLNKSEDELWQAMHQKHRNVVRRAEQEGVSVTYTTDANTIPTIHKLAQETYQRSAETAPSLLYYQSLCTNLWPKDYCQLYVATASSGSIIAAAIITTIGGYATYLHGMRSGNGPLGDSNLLQWRIIQDLKRRGFHTFDLGGADAQPLPGTKGEGIRRFKERFGGEFQRYFGFRSVPRKLEYNFLESLLNIRRHLLQVPQRLGR